MTTAERGGLSPHRAGLLAERGELRLKRAVERRSGQATRQIGLELRMLGDRAALDSLAQHRRHRDIGDAEIAGQPGPVSQRFGKLAETLADELHKHPPAPLRPKLGRASWRARGWQDV